MQAFKQQLSQDPEALEPLLQQNSTVPPDAPGPLQRLQPVIDKHLGQLVSMFKQAGCDELEALHTALQGLQQVSRPCVLAQLPALLCTQDTDVTFLFML